MITCMCPYKKDTNNKCTEDYCLMLKELATAHAEVERLSRPFTEEDMEQAITNAVKSPRGNWAKSMAAAINALRLGGKE